MKELTAGDVSCLLTLIQIILFSRKGHGGQETVKTDDRDSNAYESDPTSNPQQDATPEMVEKQVTKETDAGEST